MRRLFSEWTEQRVGYYPTVTDRQLWKSWAGCRPEAGESLILTELFHLKPEACDKPFVHVPATSDSTTSMNILCSMGSDIITFTEEEEERRSGGRWQQRNTRLNWNTVTTFKCTAGSFSVRYLGYSWCDNVIISFIMARISPREWH